MKLLRWMRDLYKHSGNIRKPYPYFDVSSILPRLRNARPTPSTINNKEDKISIGNHPIVKIIIPNELLQKGTVSVKYCPVLIGNVHNFNIEIRLKNV